MKMMGDYALKKGLFSNEILCFFMKFKTNCQMNLTPAVVVVVPYYSPNQFEALVVVSNL